VADSTCSLPSGILRVYLDETLQPLLVESDILYNGQDHHTFFRKWEVTKDLCKAGQNVLEIDVSVGYVKTSFPFGNGCLCYRYTG